MLIDMRRDRINAHFPSTADGVRLRNRTVSVGFSLVEVLIALVIGMIGMVVMLQVFANFEGQKRTSTSGGDSISSGSISLYSIQRDIQQSGWGINAIQMIGCTLTDAGNILLQGINSVPLVPVTINPPTATLPAGETGTDTLLIVSGSSNSTIEGDLINGSVAIGGTVYPVHTPSAFAAGDYVAAVKADRAVGACSVQVNKVVSTVTNAGGLGTVTVSTGALAASNVNDRLFNLGPAPLIRGYAIRKMTAATGVDPNGVDKLTVCDYTAGTDCTDADSWTPVANSVVSLRAQYRRENQNNAMTGVPDTWDQSFTTTGVTTFVQPGLGGDPAACAQMRIRAVRLAMVARSSQPERPVKDAGNNDVPVWQSALTWSGSVTNVADGNSAAAAAAVGISPTSPSATWPTWNDFRYKVFETVVPLRNVTMRGVPEEC
ncbi:MAG: PilW family protein [Rhodocyclaceae bacterium]|nr:PilW family protein [Rhodocyclaceae bacterium]